MFDLTPLYRSTVGFDRLAQMLGEAQQYDTPAYPPYNIERLNDDDYRISMAVAGFGSDDLDIEVKENTLTISGARQSVEGEEKVYLHQGIAARNFERVFQLAEHMDVVGADMENGLLHVTLKREIPEAMKPRTVSIKSVKKPKVIENKKAA
ncbi:16 kDa heat shock protein A [hydrothermal vent metagenome]|uniref:16 kDa heat shock protein A n=1 Tax=hydrothermal vent metagenome TaxID=652676 RepID=A0A3B0RKA7_9ZZZZ